MIMTWCVYASASRLNVNLSLASWLLTYGFMSLVPQLSGWKASCVNKTGGPMVFGKWEKVSVQFPLTWIRLLSNFDLLPEKSTKCIMSVLRNVIFWSFSFCCTQNFGSRKISKVCYTLKYTPMCTVYVGNLPLVVSILVCYKFITKKNTYTTYS